MIPHPLTMIWVRWRNGRARLDPYDPADAGRGRGNGDVIRRNGIAF